MAQCIRRNSPYIRLDGEIIWWQGLKPYNHRKRVITKRKIGNTVYIITAECAPDAKETVSAKLERLLFRRILGAKLDAKSYLAGIDMSLASRPDQNNYRVG